MTIPPTTILAAVDFSNSSRVALTFAARLAKHSGAALHVLHAEDPLLAAAATAHGIQLEKETRDELAIFLASASPAADCAPAIHTTSGPAATVIRETAKRVGADAIVIGMRGISAAEHLMFGSTTEAILRAADVSVFGIPDGWTPPRPETQDLTGVGPVVAAVEATDSAMQAAAAAVALAQMLHTSAEALHVVPKLRVLNRWQKEAGALAAEREDEAQRELEAALTPVTSIPLRVESGNVAERVAAAVATTASRHPILVIGRRPKATGSTAYRILTLAKAPVLQHAEQL